MPQRLSVYNTLSREEEAFKPMHDKTINMFVCGQTVYDDAHLGHARNYICFDIVARWLKHSGYDLTYIQSITDIDDKIIARAHEKKMSPEELSRYYEKRFLKDMEDIGVKQNVDMYARSHDYIEDIVMQIQLLLDKGYAYVVKGDIYYIVDKFKDYTKLSGMKLDELKKHRIEIGEGKKKPYDFALWKDAKPGEPSWKVTVEYKGKKVKLDGRPGWHIEDTAITRAVFGPQYDLHGGASELIFPHHTNEIAQAEAAFDKKPFVKYWMHCGVLNIHGEKMSKSLKNFITIQEVLKKYSAEAIRLMVASSHYRKEIEFSEDLLKDAANRLEFINQSMSIFFNMKESKTSPNDALLKSITEKLERDFKKAMDDDIDTPLAVSALWNSITELRKISETKESVGKTGKKEAVESVLTHARLLGILTKNYFKETPKEAKKLIDKRTEFRNKKNYNEADKIREKLKSEYGLIIEDTETGTKWYFNS